MESALWLRCTFPSVSFLTTLIPTWINFFSFSYIKDGLGDNGWLSKKEIKIDFGVLSGSATKPNGRWIILGQTPEPHTCFLISSRDKLSISPSEYFLNFKNLKVSQTFNY